MPKNTDKLMAAIQELERTASTEQSLATRGGEGLDQPLAQLEDAVRQHVKDLRKPDELVGHVDRPIVPSPGLDRRTEHLREELTGILEDISNLRWRIEVAGNSAAETAGSATRPAGPAIGAIDHGSVLIRRVRQLVQAPQAFEIEEADVILEAVTTDIGAGD
jgi:hypothetical protein